ncbi:biliverdin-producing heme oxygenase [Mucilaginibacter jinjuensis]|uniref:Biliverdin-producing heme oxygenase n=1 Tax=Mucilaginibacter jinjuensis TaxID=1176721 RepID=A0ABY7T798_9SPHI|nr:biliverdin-producing heme oxygenase [Mucilaginibacter jinjuensis]WCT12221.1 biliverdin-producing heme oxygenase [Mucilaginibacter jinjuensis]
MLADNLKEQTLTYHQQLEKKLVSQIKGLNTKEDYLQLLQLFYGYFGGLEDRINLFIDQNILPDHAQRRKTGAIADDILALGGEPVTKATGDALPEINNADQALGAMYVIEGSTLGGSIISKMISGKLGLTTGLSFFNSYGENTHQMWDAFKAVLNKQPAEIEAAITEAANNTFLKFKNWIEQHD